MIYVFAAGNGKMLGDHCACDAAVSSPYTIAVASCDHRGMVTHFSERCASIMVTTYSGEGENFYKVVGIGSYIFGEFLIRGYTRTVQTIGFL